MNQVRCPVCQTALKISTARSRKAKRPKTFLTLTCPEDGRHFRGFIGDTGFVSRFLDSAAEKRADMGESRDIRFAATER